MQQGSDSRGDLTTSRSTTWPPVCFVFAPLLSRAVFAQETQENRASRPQLMDNTEHAARSPPAAAQNRKRPLDGARIPSISIPSAIVPRIKEEAGQPGPAAGAEPHRGGKDHEPVTATVAVKHKRSSKPTDTREGARESTVPSAVTGIGLDSSTARARCSSELKVGVDVQFLSIFLYICCRLHGSGSSTEARARHLFFEPFQECLVSSLESIM